MDDGKQRPDRFEDVKARLEQIAETVGDESIALDEALDLFEEAVALGMQVSEVLEEDLPEEPSAAEAGALEGAVPQGAEQNQPLDAGDSEGTGAAAAALS